MDRNVPHSIFGSHLLMKPEKKTASCIRARSLSLAGLRPHDSNTACLLVCKKDQNLARIRSMGNNTLPCMGRRWYMWRPLVVAAPVGRLQHQAAYLTRLQFPFPSLMHDWLYH